MVEFEARGEDWGKTYIENLIIKIDDVETHIRIELQTQSKPVDSADEIIVNLKKYLDFNNLKYVDNTSKGGALWLLGGSELSSYIAEMQNFGIKFTYSRHGGRASGNRPAWFYQKK